MRLDKPLLDLPQEGGGRNNGQTHQHFGSLPVEKIITVVGTVPVNQIGILTDAWLRLRVVYCNSFYFVVGSLCVAGYLAICVEHRW